MAKFNTEDNVRIVSAHNLFFGYTGLVTASYEGDLMPGEIHYRIALAIPMTRQLETAQYNETYLLTVLVKEFEIDRA